MGALKHIWLKDSRGYIVKELKPTVLIGAAAVPRVFTPEIIRDMATFNEQPVIFALSNPTSMAECTAEEAYVHSDGRAVFASGSPFPTFQGFGKTYEPGQGNNAYIFPGASLGVIAAGIHHISDSVFLSAAEAVADMVTEEDLSVARLYPPLANIREISVKIATKVAEEAYEAGTASTYPEPEDKESFIRNTLYNYNYDNTRALPNLHSWPKEVQAPFN